MNVESRFEAIEKRVSLLEQGAGLNGEAGAKKSVVEMELVLPEADIDGLHFNETQVHAVFEKQDDGWYHSRDILFLSARNTESDNGRDILTKYLQRDVGYAFLTLRQQIASYFGVAVIDVEISLPKKDEGIKQYNGVGWWYWLSNKYSGSESYFCISSSNGFANINTASSVGGCAPVFRVLQKEKA
jgi:hypothetical protein